MNLKEIVNDESVTTELQNFYDDIKLNKSKYDEDFDDIFKSLSGAYKSARKVHTKREDYILLILQSNENDSVMHEILNNHNLSKYYITLDKRSDTTYALIKKY